MRLTDGTGNMGCRNLEYILNLALLFSVLTVAHMPSCCFQLWAHGDTKENQLHQRGQVCQKLSGSVEVTPQRLPFVENGGFRSIGV